MICKIIREFGLFIFWHCLDDERREKAIKKHNYLNMKTDEIDTLKHTIDDYKDKYIRLQREIYNLKVKTDSMVDIIQIKQEIDSLVKLAENDV